MKGKTAALVLGLLAALFGTATRGQAAENPEVRARAAFDRAELEFRLGHFEQALTLYKKAYASFPHPAFLFNIAQCHRNLGHPDRATFFFQRYLHDAPDATERTAVEKLIADLEGQPLPQPPVQTSTVAKNAATSGGTPSSPASPFAPRPASADTPPMTPRAEPASMSQETSGVHRRWWFWTIVGVATIAVAGGVAAATLHSDNIPNGYRQFDYE